MALLVAGIVMRIAVLSDIHGNRTAFEAVLADLRQTSPDLILHGGDLAHGGTSPAEIVDRILDLGWQGVVGNTDEMLPVPESLEEFASKTPKLQPLLDVMREMAVVTREVLGRMVLFEDLENDRGQRLDHVVTAQETVVVVVALERIDVGVQHREALVES